MDRQTAADVVRAVVDETERAVFPARLMSLARRLLEQAAYGVDVLKAGAKAESEPAKLASSSAEIKLILLLALPNHEKFTEQRLLKRISTEEPFASASPKTIRKADAGFAELDSRFQELE